MTTPDLTSAVIPELATTEAEELRKRKQKIILFLFLAAAILLLLLLLWIRSGPSTGLPGIGAPANLPRYSFSIYGVARPLGVAVSPSGDRVYVSESNGPRLVHVFDREGKQVGTLQPPKATGAGHVPVYLAVDPLTSDVYVSDRIARTVYVYDAEGVYKKEFKPSSAELGRDWQPLGLAFDPQGNLYVTDVSGPSNRVLSFGRDDKRLRVYGADGQFSFPNGIAVDRWGNVYVADSNSGRVVVFDKAGKLVTMVYGGSATQRFGLPRGEAIDSSNRLYVVDTTDQSVQVLGLQDEGVAPPKNIGSFSGDFAYPNGIATDNRRVYVTDRENNRVQVWNR